MTDVHEYIQEVEESEAFETFSRESPEAYLVHVFSNVKQGQDGVEVGYYLPGKDAITVFTRAPVKARPPEDVFKEHGTVPRLEIGKVEVGFARARALADEYRKEHYPTHPVMQEICILQQMDVPVWNMTLVTQTLNMLNLRIDAASGAVIRTDMQNILSLRK